MILRELLDEDIELVKKWMGEPHVAKWFGNPEEWIKEIVLRKTKYDFICHFIVEVDGYPIGFCQYYDYSKGGEDWNGSVPLEGSFSIDYMIGEVNFLGHGNGTKIVKLLTEEIRCKTSAKRIIAQPEPENTRSRNTLLSSGYVYDERNDLYYCLIEEFWINKYLQTS